MARINGVEISNNKRVVISLTQVKGIGLSTSKKILADANVSEDIRVKNLTDEELARIRTEASKYLTGGELDSQVKQNIERLKAIGCYRGIRHRKGLPVRGQNTRNNARTRKGKKKTVTNKKK